MKTKILSFVAVLACAVLLAGCFEEETSALPEESVLTAADADDTTASPDIAAEEAPADAAPLSAVTDKTWLLEDIKGRGIAEGSRSTLLIAANGEVSGEGGCNRFSGKADIAEDGTLSFGPLLSTKRACVVEEMNNQETEYLAALSGVRGWYIGNDGLLYLTDEAEAEVLHFSEEPETAVQADIPVTPGVAAE